MKVKKKYLFVCSVNINRSKTAEHFFKNKNLPGYEFKSCGTDVDFIEEHKEDMTANSVPIDENLINWAEVILCMENRHADYIKETFGDEARKKAYVLNIPDIYSYRHPELEMILENKVKFNLIK